MSKMSKMSNLLRLDIKQIKIRGNKMTPAQTAKSMGLKSLTQARDMLGTNKNGHPMVSLNTLTNWHRNKPELFEVVMLGCLEKLNKPLETKE